MYGRTPDWRSRETGRRFGAHGPLLRRGRLADASAPIIGGLPSVHGWDHRGVAVHPEGASARLLARRDRGDPETESSWTDTVLTRARRRQAARGGRRRADPRAHAIPRSARRRNREVGRTATADLPGALSDHRRCERRGEYNRSLMMYKRIVCAIALGAVWLTPVP